MKPGFLIGLTAELMFTFRYTGEPADTACRHYFHAKKFLGSSDRRFISNSFFHALRNLLRIDETIRSVFEGAIPGERRPAAGFPVSDSSVVSAWRPHRLKRSTEVPKAFPEVHLVDTLRSGLAALELGYITWEQLGEEVDRCWPASEERRRLPQKRILDLCHSASDTLKALQQVRSPADLERAYSLPGWLWSMMARTVRRTEWEPMAESLGREAPTTARINTLRTTKEDAVAALDEAGISYHIGELNPHAVLLDQRLPFGKIPRYRDGWFEIQDEGSQLVSIFAEPKPGQTVVDACAGGGGKTLHFAELMGNEGKIFAFDIEPGRLENLENRAQRAGVQIVDTSIKLDEEGKPQGLEKLIPYGADMVLLDVPCSGTGTMRRSPEIRWRFSLDRLRELMRTQKKLLEAWAPRVRRGGLLLYATCSLLPEENEEQVEAFLEKHPGFHREPIEDFRVKLTKSGDLRLFPHREGTDGFYAARLRRG